MVGQLSKRVSTLKEFLSFAKAFSDENRVRILLALRDQELCVCQLIMLLKLAPSTVSKHLVVLKQAGLVELRKEGRWAYYRLAGERVAETASRALEWMIETTKTSRRALDDRAALRKILECDRDELCKRLSGE
jgi:ArsR family transcriptional regulator